MEVEDRDAGADVDRKNRWRRKSQSMQARHNRTNAVIQSDRHRHVQLRRDTFAGDCVRKDRMRRELITVGRLVQELELLIRERQQGESASRLERPAYIYRRAILGGVAQTRPGVGLQLRQLSEIDRYKLIARRRRRRDRVPICRADLDLEAAQPRHASGGSRQFRTIADQPALWPARTRVTWRLPQRQRRLETRVHLRVVHWSPILLPARLMARFGGAV